MIFYGTLEKYTCNILDCHNCDVFILLLIGELKRGLNKGIVNII